MTADIISFPGTLTVTRFRSGTEYKWHCPLAGCWASGRYVKRRTTAINGLARHREKCHESC